MKYIASALVLVALLGTPNQVSAIRLQARFTDDLVKSLAEEMNKDLEETQSTTEETPKTAAAQNTPA